MSAYRFVTLTCDGCGEIHDSGSSATVAHARKVARAEAWTSPARNDDRCPVCSGTHEHILDGHYRKPSAQQEDRT